MLPSRLMVYADWIRPSRHVPYGGGPMKGQHARRAMMRHLALTLAPTLVIETGTHRGGSTAFLADITGVPVLTVEAWERSFHFAAWRFRDRADISVHHADSRDFLRARSQDRATSHTRVLFYIDSHGGESLPLRAELEAIAAGWTESAVVIDDFEVPDDPGYGFDDWGPGARLSEEILPAAVDAWTRLYPATPSIEESGIRRGCVVLVSPDLDAGTLARGCLRQRDHQS